MNTELVIHIKGYDITVHIDKKVTFSNEVSMLEECIGSIIHIHYHGSLSY